MAKKYDAEVERIARLLHQSWVELAAKHPTIYPEASMRKFDDLIKLSKAAYRHVARAIVADRKRQLAVKQ
jgi:hypothetical protein